MLNTFAILNIARGSYPNSVSRLISRIVGGMIQLGLLKDILPKEATSFKFARIMVVQLHL